MPIKDLPADARPREKLLARGAGALSDTELLALLLRSAPRGDDVLSLAQRTLDRCGGMAGLLRAPASSLAGVRGLGPAKRAEIAAVLEIAQRALGTELARTPVFDTPNKVKDFVALHLRGLGHEVFAVLFLDAQHRLIAWEPLFRGTLTQTSVYPREVVKRALALNAGAAIVAHNHPSGLAEPSLADETMTRQLKAALALVDVRLLDHLVVGATEVVSLAERGLL